jgi:hypothetical protein
MNLDPRAGRMPRSKPDHWDDQKRRISDERTDELVARLTGEDEIRIEEASRPEEDDTTPLSVEEASGLDQYRDRR